MRRHQLILTAKADNSHRSRPCSFSLRRATGDVRFGPKADIARLFDHLISLCEHGWRQRKAECLGSLEIYHKVESSGLLHRQVGRLRAFQDFGHLSGGSSEHILGVRPIGHQATIDGELPLSVHGRQLALCAASSTIRLRRMKMKGSSKASSASQRPVVAVWNALSRPSAPCDSTT